MSPLRRRRFAHGAPARYTGVSWIQGVVDCPEASLAPEVVRRLGEGTYMMVGPTKDGAGSLLSGLQRFGAEAGDRRATFMVHPRTVDTGDSHALAKALGLSREMRGLVCDKAALRRVREVLAEELSHPGWPAEYRACASAISGDRGAARRRTPSALHRRRLARPPPLVRDLRQLRPAGRLRRGHGAARARPGGGSPPRPAGGGGSSPSCGSWRLTFWPARMGSRASTACVRGASKSLTPWRRCGTGHP